ncbi:porphobilinogen synthase [Candidatus Hakubella thermalkaliphila]|uniref:Delta-aminolevulinic acid dehydratase n=1 Tax=Candidatus Hakubella thermalkaliphila TaxID=2754717 RepID=A0A6V8NM48_9ACTN|nr:porphobilinogen synthase [Candidatus Hakubella thermalkaliphila]GFP21392.1 porphobilinogen synthase [Candidatus Hakubella thermalkaliphila]
MFYPKYRLRRLRRTENLRRLIRETQLSVDHLIYPLFVVPGKDRREEISTMPGCYRFSLDKLRSEIKEIEDLGIPAVLFFGIPSQKDEVGSEAYADKGIIQEAIRATKEVSSDLIVITDVCLCEYTSHGHCGIPKNGEIDNDSTLEILSSVALSQVRAGVDMVAPSDMMDGRVAAIRERLDEEGYSHIPIMSYAAKYCSGFYGPFREAAESAPRFGDRRSHQMDPPNSDEAMREIAQDIEEGADIVMVKPALAYLDIIYRAKSEFGYPLAAYNVSGEYSMIKAAAAKNWIDEKRIVLEILTSIKRAGADMILTYFARDVARWLA